MTETGADSHRLGQARVPSDKPAATGMLLPPWIWFWVLWYLTRLPGQWSLWQARLGELIGPTPPPGEQLIPAGFLLRFSNVAELVPLAAVLLGVVSIFVPHLRAKYLQRRYRLVEPAASVPALGEIAAFVQEKAPGLTIKTNLLLVNQTAFAYAAGYCRMAIAVFGGLVKLWREDRAQAEAILLHEIAHCRQKEALAVGLGSPFRFLLNSWLYVYALFVQVPLIVVWLVGVYTGTGVANFYAAFALLFNSSVTLLLWTAQALTLPLAAIWLTELNADFYAAKAQSSGALSDVLTRLPPARNWWQWLFQRMSHPPTRMRLWAAKAAERPYGATLLLLLFPLAFLVQLAILLAMAGITYLAVYASLDMSLADIVLTLAKNAATYFASAVPAWVAMAVVVFIWPLLVAMWERRTLVVQELRRQAPAALLICVLAAGGSAYMKWILGPGNGPDVIDVGLPPGELAPGEEVQVEWQGSWYDAVILEAGEGKYYIHYHGYDGSWDEWVGRNRIRRKSADQVGRE